MDIRRLVILNINDRPVDTFAPGKNAAKHFEVHNLASWPQVQAILAGHKSGPAPDLLLLDVSFDQDGSLRGAAIQGLEDSKDLLVPMGPILALPFLNSRSVMGFAPYSAHMENPALKQHPPFLVAMGLVAAKMAGGQFSSRHLSLNTDQDEPLDNFLDNLEAAGDPVKGLKMALPMYRRNLMKAVRERRIFILSSKPLIDAFDRLQAELEQRPGDDSFVDVPGEIHMEMIDDHDNHDRVSIHSLFADKMQWVNSYLDMGGLNEVLEWLEEMTGLEPCFPKAVEVIRFQDATEDKDPWGRRPRVDWVIRELYGDRSDDERREIFRLCVLFANVHAWSLKKGISLEKQLVYKRLGFSDRDDADGDEAGGAPDTTPVVYKVTQRTYQSWFAARPGTSPKPNTYVAQRTIKVEALLPLDASSPAGGLDSCFLQKGSIVTWEDHQLIKKYRRLFGGKDDEAYGSWNEPYLIRR